MQEEDEKTEKSEIAQKEEEILAFWNKNDIFKKSEEKEAPQGDFVFYDGPPFANGLPHYGHIIASVVKDSIPRYKTMRGFRVRRRWGWDCHGLPVETLIEKELGLKTKRDIEEYGIAKFNEQARISIMKDVDAWKQIVPRMGRWADMENDYKTMDTTYTESVWWSFSELWKNDLIYEGFKSMHLCPRCGTTLSNFEVNLGYKDIVDFAVTVNLELVDEPGTYLLVWTTTPWTLPGNMAAAVHEDEEYVKVKAIDHEGKEARYILGRDRATHFFKEGEYEVLETFKGSTLVGRSYIPPFDYFKEKDLKGKENAWKIYHAPYVSMSDGTGAVHLAPVYGGEDLDLAQKENIPLYHHVTKDGVFTEDVHDLKGMSVKPKGDHQSTDIEIIKRLAHRGMLFKKEKITHSYPLCWRCDTPLLVYAASSWFVRVVSMRDDLVAENKKIRWVPEEIGTRRFGNWLEGARDWAISRSRYWGAPIPVWKHSETGECTVMGSIGALKQHVKRSGNRYFLMRHGDAELTASQVISSKADPHNALTQKGKEDVQRSVEGVLKDAQIKYIVTSPLPRTFQTALLVAKELGVSEDNVFVDPRLTEISFGEYEGKTISEYHAFYKSVADRLTKAPEGGETWNAVKRRVGELLYELEAEYKDSNLLIISHNGPLQMLQAAAEGLDVKQVAEVVMAGDFSVQPAEVRELSFVPLPHNADYVLDLHRPYIDDVELVAPDGVRLNRILDVFDCWYESGSMPYGQMHYPFENKDIFEPRPNVLESTRGYPADFISESLDQTRGWFYSLLVLGQALFGRAPYKSVIVGGLVLAEDGQKMSKRLKNYPDPMKVVDTYGADALRYYLVSSPLMRGEDLNFSEKGVAEVMRKLVTRLRNVRSFLELYGGEGISEYSVSSENLLDRWIQVRLRETVLQMTTAMEAYELDVAARPLMALTDDLSTWYLRRSRERMKGDDVVDAARAYGTLKHVLGEVSKLMAPFMPFYAEELHKSLSVAGGVESVHLAAWPEVIEITSEDKELLSAMEETRRLVSLALEARQTKGVRVRQPLSLLRVRPEYALSEESLALIRDEVNVKAVEVDVSLPEAVFLDVTLTDELKQEGAARDLIRQIQELRKERGLQPREEVTLSLFVEGAASQMFLDTYADKVARETFSKIDLQSAPLPGTVLEVNDLKFWFALAS